MPGSNGRSANDLGSMGISRRDFLNGCLIASGALAFRQFAPFRASAAETAGVACDDVVGNDPRFLRSGNLPSVFDVGHWLRDRRLSFEPGAVTLAPGCDAHAGKFDISDDGMDFDVIIVGAGIAGLSAAYFLMQGRPGTRVLLLEASNYAGGNAARDEGSPLPVAASTAGAYCLFPYTDFLRKIYREIGIDWEKYIIKPPSDCFFFDENTPGVKPGYRGWRLDFPGSPDKLKTPPYSQRIIDDLARCVKTFEGWSHKPGKPNDPPEISNPRYDYLSEMTLAEYLTNVLHCDPIVVDFYTGYTTDCMGGTAYSVNAHSSICFLSSEYGQEAFAYPGGTSEIAARLVHWLTKSGARKGADHAPEIRLNAVALRVDADTSLSKAGVSVTYFKDRKFHRASAKAMIIATQSSSARHLVDHLIDADRRAAWQEFNTVPALVANVAVRNMAPFVELGLGYANHLWGSRHWSNFEIADWTTENRKKPDRASVLTFYNGITAPPEEFPAERMKLLQTPFADYEKSLREDLARVMRGTAFDFDRHVSAIYIYRWGHSLILPTTKSVFGNVRGPDGRLDRSKAPRRVACRPLGPISFAGQHTEGSPSVEAAIGSGHRAAGEVLAGELRGNSRPVRPHGRR
jgi:spermidine dehydrogenase